MLVMNALHISMDCIALVVSLFSIVLASKKPSSTFTYGFERIEVINAFSMACFLMFMGFFQIMEALHHAFSSVEIESGESKNGIFALAIGILGFVLDLFGLLMLRKYSNLNHARKFRGKYNGARMVNMHGLFLHTLCDSFSQAVVVFIAWLDRFQVTSIEILITWIIGFAMVYTAYPLLVLTGSILLQSSPRELKPILEKHLREISTFDGVLECRTAHWWSQSPGSVIGTLNVRVRTDANEQEILTFIHQLLHEYVSDLTIQIEKDAPIDWMTHHTN